MADSFFDTNTLIYLMGADLAKSARTEELVSQGGVISVQVLNELANVCRRKIRLEWTEVQVILDTVIGLLEVRNLTLNVHRVGMSLAERHKLSVYDAMIVASALDAGCTTLWSEDMHHGLKIENQLRVINPFITKSDF